MCYVLHYIFRIRPCWTYFCGGEGWYVLTNFLVNNRDMNLYYFDTHCPWTLSQFLKTKFSWSGLYFMRMVPVLRFSLQWVLAQWIFKNCIDKMAADIMTLFNYNKWQRFFRLLLLSYLWVLMARLVQMVRSLPSRVKVSSTLCGQ